MDPIVVLKGVVPPVAAALLLVSLGGTRLLPLAMAVGLFVAYGLLKEWPAWPHELWHAPDGASWLVWGVVAAGCVALLEPVGGAARRVGAVVGPLLGAGAMALVLEKVARGWPADQALLHVGGGAAIVAALVVAHRGVLARAPAGIAPAVLFTLVLSVDAGVLTLGRSGLLGQMCGAVAAALGAAAGTTLWRRPFVFSPSHGTWLGITHGLFVLAGVHLAYVAWPVAGCVLLAPCLPLLLRGRLAARPVAWFLIAALLVAIPLGAALWLSFAAETGPY